MQYLKGFLTAVGVCVIALIFIVGNRQLRGQLAARSIDAFRKSLQRPGVVCLGHPVDFEHNVEDEDVSAEDLRLLKEISANLPLILAKAELEVAKYVKNDPKELAHFTEPTITFYEAELREDPSEWSLVFFRDDTTHFSLTLDFRGLTFYAASGGD
jgi:hypothetical protein